MCTAICCALAATSEEQIRELRPELSLGVRARALLRSLTRTPDLTRRLTRAKLTTPP